MHGYDLNPEPRAQDGLISIFEFTTDEASQLPSKSNLLLKLYCAEVLFIPNEDSVAQDQHAYLYSLIRRFTVFNLSPA